jgi:acetyl-CoA carboxylase biotin carboxyl carrier protein
MSDTETPGEPGSDETLDARLVRELATVLNDTGLTEIEVERGDLRIRVAKTVTLAPAMIPASSPPPSQAQPTAPVMQVSPAEPTRAAGEQIKSPMVGTVYLQAQPGTPPFVKVGDRVTQGQTILLLEAMKTMNPIAAPRDGTIVEILVGDGQPVEYGEPLAIIG